MRRFLLITVGLALLATFIQPTPARTQIWGPNATAEMAYQGNETLSLFCLPDGTGDAFAEAYLQGGARADATITLIINDWYGNPIAHFPAEDIWIASQDRGMVPCGNAAFADADTDAAGETRWSRPLSAGGHSQTLCIVYINGDALTSNGGLPLSFNSADIDGNGVVNLTDAGFFTSYLGGWSYAGDFNNDGVVNISDAGMIAGSLGTSCP